MNADRCGSRKVEVFKASGKGALHSYVIHHRPTPGFTPPYSIAVVELEEGPRTMGNVTGVDPDDMQIGTPVEVYFVQADEGVAVPFWRQPSNRR